MAKHYYRVDFQDGEKGRVLSGSSPLPLEKFMDWISTQPFVRLDDLTYRDTQNRVYSWDNWDASIQPTAYINCKCVTTVMPMVGDPLSKPA